MARFHSMIIIAGVLALPAALGGCVGVAVVGGLAAAAGGGYAAGQERGLGTAASDYTLKSDVDQAMIKADPQLQRGVTTTVYQGRVLLTGRVANAQQKATAQQVAARTHDVRALYDEIEVASPESAWDDAHDAWITTRVRSDLVFDPAIRSVNYTVDTANGSVYLIGSARSQAELEEATRVARYVPGVKRVVSYVEIRGGAPVAAMPPRPPGGGGMMPPAGAAGQAPIEVQKL
jgi:osmotically-inducible protein OsmY